MKAILPRLAAACALIFLGGCVVQCVNPLFSEKEYIPFPGLIGTWVQKEKDQKQSLWTFEPDGKRYKLTHMDEDGHKATFEVAAGRIGTNMFLSSYLDDPVPGAGMNLFAAVHFVPIFTFAKVAKIESGLMLVPLDLQWLARQIESNPQFVPNIMRPNGTGGDHWPLLTATTEELQKFVAKYADDIRAFTNEIKLVSEKTAKQPR